jgi:hypothetical protein
VLAGKGIKKIFKFSIFVFNYHRFWLIFWGNFTYFNTIFGVLPGLFGHERRRTGIVRECVPGRRKQAQIFVFWAFFREHG